MLRERACMAVFLAGWHVGRLFGLVKRSAFFVGMQCGIDAD